MIPSAPAEAARRSSSDVMVECTFPWWAAMDLLQVPFCISQMLNDPSEPPTRRRCASRRGTRLHGRNSQSITRRVAKFPRSQTRILLSPLPLKSRFPSCENCMQLTALVCPRRVPIRLLSRSKGKRYSHSCQMQSAESLDGRRQR